MQQSLRILAFLIALLVVYSLAAQEPKVVEIRLAGGYTQDQVQFPGANILFKNPEKRVLLFHEGALIESDLAYFYA